MKISKNLSWVEEYINLVKPLVPEISRLKRVTSKKPKRSLTENQNCHGIISFYSGKRMYTLTLYTHYIDMNLKNDKVHLNIAPYSTIDTLCFLAHELAHLKHWDHTPAHKLLEASITQIFMNKLESSGYKSEEDEASYWEPCTKLT